MSDGPRVLFGRYRCGCTDVQPELGGGIPGRCHLHGEPLKRFNGGPTLVELESSDPVEYGHREAKR